MCRSDTYYKPSEKQIQPWRIVVAPLDNNLRILLLNDVGVLVEHLPVAARVTAKKTQSSPSETILRVRPTSTGF